jgi:DUF4097 and DUF4098 domain-containing protein YvlB
MEISMNKSCRTILLITLLCGGVGLAHAGDRVDESRSVESDTVVEIHNTRGEIRITGWDKDEISVEGELDDLATGLTFEVDGKLALIRVEMPTRNINWGDGSDLEIKIPVNGRIDFDGVSTDLYLKNIMGGIAVHSVSGEIEARGIDNRIQINAVSGDIDIQDAGGKAKITTVSGDMELDLRSEMVSVNAVSGDINLRLQTIDTLMASVVSGEIDVEGNLADSGSINCNSVSGDVTLVLAAPVNARIDVQTGPGGDIDNRITEDEARDIFPAQMALKSRSGDGSGNISVHTVTGDVTLKDRD